MGCDGRPRVEHLQHSHKRGAAKLSSDRSYLEAYKNDNADKAAAALANIDAGHHMEAQGGEPSGDDGGSCVPIFVQVYFVDVCNQKM